MCTHKEYEIVGCAYDFGHVTVFDRVDEDDLDRMLAQLHEYPFAIVDEWYPDENCYMPEEYELWMFMPRRICPAIRKMRMCIWGLPF